jgi:hypothetical protein
VNCVVTRVACRFLAGDSLIKAERMTLIGGTGPNGLWVTPEFSHGGLYDLHPRRSIQIYSNSKIATCYCADGHTLTNGHYDHSSGEF